MNTYGNIKTITFSKKCSILLCQNMITLGVAASVKITLNDKEILNYSAASTETVANHYKQTEINVNAGDILKVIYTVGHDAYAGGQTILVI